MLLLLLLIGAVGVWRHERARRELSIENLRFVAEVRGRVELGPEARRRRRGRVRAADEAAAAARGKPGAAAAAAAVSQGRDGPGPALGKVVRPAPGLVVAEGSHGHVT